MADGATARASVAEPGGAEGPGSLSLAGTTALAGAYRFVERRLFELTGRWAAEPGFGAEAQVLLFEASARHAFCAGLWGDRLPVIAGVDADELTALSGAPLEPVLDILAGSAAPGSTAPGATDGPLTDPPGGPTADALLRLAALYRVVLPRLLVSYRLHLAIATGVADGPVRRALRLVLMDHDEPATQGEALVERIIRPGGARAAAVAAAERQLAAVLAAAGAGDGLVPWPEDQAVL